MKKRMMPVMACFVVVVLFFTACGSYYSDVAEDNVTEGVPVHMPPPSGALPPMVFVDDILYIISPMRHGPIMDESWTFIGEIESYVDNVVPTGHLQSNFGTIFAGGEFVNIADMRVYHSPNALFRLPLYCDERFGENEYEEFYSDAIVVVANGQHFPHASEAVRDRSNEILSQRISQKMFINDRLYVLRAWASGGGGRLDDGFVFLGEIESSVSPNVIPTENFQANDEIVGARVYKMPPDSEFLGDIVVMFRGRRLYYSALTGGWH